MIKAAIIGASGYTGLELARLLLGHPEVQIKYLTSEKSVGKPFSEVFPAFYKQLDLTFSALNVDLIAPEVDVVFLCLPHHASMNAAAAFLDRGLKVIDLSADFRLKSKQTYEMWYGPHTQEAYLKEAVYGLPELYREQIKTARLVANPGCYPTSIALGLAPFLRETGLVDLSSLIIDSKSGVSGAGRSANIDLIFPELNDNFKAYKAGGSHRHLPEIEQSLSEIAQTPIQVTFTPHLLPIDRGILSTIYLKPLVQKTQDEWEKFLLHFYQNEAFVRVRRSNDLPQLKSLRGTNFCDIACVLDEHVGRLVVFSAIDNLCKGASGQALQNFNLMFGFDEKTGLVASHSQL